METPILATVWRPGEEASCKMDLNVDDMTKVLEALAAHGYIILKKGDYGQGTLGWHGARLVEPSGTLESRCLQ